MIWGPTNKQMIYAGLRFTLKEKKTDNNPMP
jgi:hypothetical protein